MGTGALGFFSPWLHLSVALACRGRGPQRRRRAGVHFRASPTRKGTNFVPAWRVCYLRELGEAMASFSSAFVSLPDGAVGFRCTKPELDMRVTKITDESILFSLVADMDYVDMLASPGGKSVLPSPDHQAYFPYIVRYVRTLGLTPDVMTWRMQPQQPHSSPKAIHLHRLYVL